MQVRVRRGDHEDFPHLMPLVASMHSESGLPTDGRSEAALLALLTDARFGLVLVASAGESKAVGYLILGFGYSLEFRGKDAFVDELFVIPSQRWRGVGTALPEAAEEECARAGVAALHLEVDNSNTQAFELYRRLGYEDHRRHLMTKWIASRNRPP